MDIQNSAITSERWSNKISNIQQMGGIETSVLDNGSGRNTRIAWVNTGSGLRFKVVLDRAMDIVDASFNQHNLSWLSHKGISSPDSSATEGIKWLNTFGGGLLTTCGITHIGGPEEDQYGKRGLHDRISHTPAEIESIIQPDLRSGNLEMSLTGKMLQYTTFGPQLELKRTILAKLGHSKITIHDEVTNAGNQPSPHMILYHINFGWPLADQGAFLEWNGKCKARDEESETIFNEDNNFKRCPAPLDSHSGPGEAAGYIDVEPDSNGVCRSSIKNSQIGLGVEVSFKKEQLPWLTNWQHWGRHEYVTALEPGTHPPIGQASARKNNTLLKLEPGETASYDLELKVVNID